MDAVVRENREEEAEQEPLKSGQIIIGQEMRQAVEELHRPSRGLFASGLIAGLGVGVSLFLMATVMTLSEDSLAEPLTALLIANAYAVGFIIVIMGRTDLFTEYTTIAILPVLFKRASVRALGRLWGLVYVANLIGAALFAGFTTLVGPALGVIEPSVLSRISLELVSHPWWIIVLSGLFAGWLMGLLSWLVTAGRDTISQIFFVWLVTGSIGFARLHHSITGSVEVLAGVLTHEAIGLIEYGHFLLWSTLGNIIGGVLFAVLIRYSVLIGSSGEDRLYGPRAAAAGRPSRSTRQARGRIESSETS